MCAIAGIIGPSINKISKMIDVQKHRGQMIKTLKLLIIEFLWVWLD